jgi:hypothetical protein
MIFFQCRRIRYRVDERTFRKGGPLLPIVIREIVLFAAPRYTRALNSSARQVGNGTRVEIKEINPRAIFESVIALRSPPREFAESRRAYYSRRTTRRDTR